jgi:hypothetical protein
MMVPTERCSLGDVTKLVGLLLKPFINAWKFEQ